MSHAWRLACLGLLLVSARAEARGCHDVSEIVGEQHCTRFGDWDVTHSHAWVASIGTSVEVNPMIGSRFSVLATGAQGPVRLFGISGRDLQDRGVAIAPMTLRVTMFPRRIFYLGIEALWIGYGIPSGPDHPTNDLQADAGALAMHSTDFFMLSLGGVAGASLPVGRFDFAVEIFGGFRALSQHLQFDDPAAAAAALGSCLTDTNQQKCSADLPMSNWAFDARLEPRVGIGVRLTRMASARVLVGFDVLALGAVHVAAMVELHTRDYDAFFTRPTHPTGQ